MMKGFWLGFVLLPLCAQSNVSGSVPITLVDGGLGCGGSARIIEVHADVSGLSGDLGAAAGLNGFKITLGYTASGVYTHATSGSAPLSWSMVSTSPPNTATSVTLVGWNTNTQAPNTNYHLCDVYLSGPNANVTISVLQAELASRLVAPGNGPDSLNVTLPQALTVFVPSFTLDLPEAIASWHQINPTYNLIGPPGPNDVLDLVKAFICMP